MEAIRDVYSSSDSSDEGEMLKNEDEVFRSSTPLHESPPPTDLLSRKRSLKPDSNDGSKKKSRTKPAVDLPPPPPSLHAKRASTSKTADNQQRKAGLKPALSLNDVMCPPRQVQTKQSNISTEDLVSYGCRPQRNQRR